MDGRRSTRSAFDIVRELAGREASPRGQAQSLPGTSEESVCQNHRSRLMDSVTMAHNLCGQGNDLYLLSIDYGQRHRK